MRYVTNIPNRAGLIELGPCEGAFALGDTLSITPVAAALGKRAIMLMPKAMAHLRFLFRELCPVGFTENYPLFRWTFEQNAVAQKLRIFGLASSSPLPIVHPDPVKLKKVKPMLSGMPCPIAFSPTCSKHWSHIRQRPSKFWEPIVLKLAQRFTVCQFGFSDYPTVSGAKRMPFVDLEELACLYHLIGNYVGTDTGDYHLMLAVGGRCIVAEPDPIPPMQERLWVYDAPTRLQYGKLSSPKSVLEAAERLPL